MANCGLTKVTGLTTLSMFTQYGWAALHKFPHITLYCVAVRTSLNDRAMDTLRCIFDTTTKSCYIPRYSIGQVFVEHLDTNGEQK